MQDAKPFIPDYSKYSLGELEDIYSRMQKDNFIERVEAIENEIKKKKDELSFNPSLENLEKSKYTYEYASFWKRAAATGIDGIIALLFLPLTNYLYVLSFNNKTILPLLLENILFTIIIQYYFIIKYGGTPGHLILQLRTINNSRKFLNIKQAFLRSLTDLPYLIFMLLQINNTINKAPARIDIQSIADIAPLLKEYGGIYTLLTSLFSFFVILDVAVVLLNDKKRAIHDFIAGSYVVTKKSIEAIERVKVSLIHA